MGKVAKIKHMKAAGVMLDGDGNELHGLGRKLAERIDAAWKLKVSIDDSKKALDALNADILKDMEPGHAALVPGVARVACVERETVSVAEGGEAVLRKVLGGRFDDLVEESTRFKVLPKLKAIAADGDNPLADAVREALVIKVGQNLTYRPAA